MCYVCSSANKKYGDKCGRTFGYSRDEAVKAGVLVSCDDIGVKNARACGKMITNAYAGGNYGAFKKNDISRQLTTVTSILWNLLHCMCWFWRKYGSNNVVFLHMKLSNHCFTLDKCWIEPNNSVKFSLFFPEESWVFCLRPVFYQTHLSVADITLLNSQVHH